jgi:hypothetical protein
MKRRLVRIQYQLLRGYRKKAFWAIFAQNAFENESPTSNCVFTKDQRLTTADWALIS